MTKITPKTKNPAVPPNAEIRAVRAEELLAACSELHFAKKLQLLTIAAADGRAEGRGFRIFYVFGEPASARFTVLCLDLGDQESFPSITKEIHAASGFERKIKSFFGLEPDGHPHPRAMLLHENWPAGAYPLRKDFKGDERVPEAKGSYEFSRVEGEGIYEIPVGPIHAGIIEPGHFRFSVAGEEIVLLEAKLGYKHRGVEKLFEKLSLAESVGLAEHVSGDTSFTHALAFSQAVESLANIQVPARAKYLRVIYSELERLANHLNDIGFILMDTGFSFGGANGGRLRETVMQMHEKIAGNRFLRGVSAIGGVNKDINFSHSSELLSFLENLRTDFEETIAVCQSSATVDNRLESTGKLDKELAADHGVVGVAARALGSDCDTRKDYPYAAYSELAFVPAKAEAGDVKARFSVRLDEVRSSIGLVVEALKKMPAGPIKAEGEIRLAADAIGLGLTEGWRGGIVYFLLTDSKGAVTRVEVRDPSFVNWTVLGHSGKGNVVPDFPLINKSFNLSYSGNDL